MQPRLQPTACRASPLLAVVLVLALASHCAVLVTAEGCPNSCRENGICGSDNVCTCYNGYTGNDCSLRSCPTGAAWIQKATAVDTAHSSGTECSNAGLCDRSTGNCKCFEGFDGEACQRTTCPNSCSGRGVCTTMKRIASEYGLDTGSATMGDGAGPSYTVWDSEVQYGCVCDWGFTGPDCSLRYCAYTDDPETTAQYDRAISFTTDNTVDEVISGSFYIWFNGHRSGAISADADTATATVCKEAFEEMEIIESARCFQGTVSGTNKRVATYTVALKFAEYGMNNLFHVDSTIPLSTFTCDGSDISAATGTVSCAVADVDTSVRDGGPRALHFTYNCLLADECCGKQQPQRRSDNHRDH